MSTTDTEPLPPGVSTILLQHRKETQTLRVNLRQLAKRVNLATAELPEVREDVTMPRHQERLTSEQAKDPYFLKQPKAKQSGALKVGETIIVKTQDGWEKANLEAATAEYKNGSYMWTYHFQDSGDACSSFLSPGESWGALRDGDQDLDFTRLDPRIMTGPASRYRLQSTCSACNQKGLEAFQEEAEFLESRLPLLCAHQQQITAISVIGEPSEAAAISLVEVPRPKQQPLQQPPAPPSMASTTCSTVTLEKLETYTAKVASQFEVMCSVHATLCEELASLKRAGKRPQLAELEEEVLEELLMDYTDKVTEETTRAEEKLAMLKLQLDRENVFLPPMGDRLNQGGLLSRGSQGGFEEAAFRNDLDMLNLSGSQTALLNKEALVTVEKEVFLQQPPVTSMTRLQPPLEPEKVQKTHTQSTLLPGTEETHQDRPLHRTESSTAPTAQEGETSPEEAVWAGQVEAARIRIQADSQELAEELHSLPAQPGRAAIEAIREMAANIDKDLGGFDQLQAQYALAVPAGRRDQTLKQGAALRLQLGQELRDIKRKLRGYSYTVQQNCQEPSERPRSFIEKIKLPTYSGQLEAWPDFLKAWSDITAPEKMTDAVELLCLRQHIPQEARDLLDGVQDMVTAWSRLKRKYGDRDLMILHVTRRLNCITLSGQSYEQVEKLALECERAVTLLKHFNAETLLLNDFELVAKLSSKLPSSLLLSWDVSCSERGGDSPASWPYFLNWLRSQREVAHFSRLRSLTREASTTGAKGSENRGGVASLTCSKCHIGGHTARECTSPTTQDLFSANAGRFQTEAEYKSERPEISKRTGKCPFCRGEHTYQRQMAWGKVDFPSSCFDSCSAWKAASVKERAGAVEKAKGCPQCTSWNHPAARCWFRRKVECPASVGGQACRKAHHLMLHNSENTYCVAATSGSPLQIQSSLKARPGKKARQRARKQADRVKMEGNIVEEEVHNGEPVVLEVQNLTYRAKLGGREVPGETLWDSGSQGSLCTHQWAERLNLKQEAVTYYLQVVGQGAAKKETQKYYAELQDKDGRWHRIHFLGIETLTSPGVPSDLQVVQHLFPGIPDEVFQPRKKPIEVLIGKNFNSLMPDGGILVDNMQVKQSKFGTGYVLSGWSKMLAGPPQHLTAAAQLLASASEEPSAEPNPVQFSHLRTRTFLELEELGTAPKKYCKKCLGCNQCSFRGQSISRDQEAVVRAMEESLERDPSTGQLTISYPFLPCAEQMRYNSRQAVAIQTKVEQRLERDGLLEQYNEEMRKTIERGAVVPLGEEDLQYKGPIHYITHFGVINLDSLSTSLRIVSNSASKNQHSRLSLNDCMEDGPNTLNGLLQVLVGWRSLEVGLLYDLSKAYQRMKTRIKEKNLRRLVWRPRPGEAWKHFGYDCANFGDKLAPLALEIGKKKTAEEGEKIDSMAAEQLLTLTYVDDNCGGGSEEDVKRMVGLKEEEPGTISRILKKCNFQAKAFVTSGMEKSEEAGALGEKVLGVRYCAVTDKLTMKLKPVVLSPGARVRTAKLASSDLLVKIQKGQTKMTKRMALSFVNGQYDPLGLLAPVSLKLKLRLKQLYRPERKYEWD